MFICSRIRAKNQLHTLDIQIISKKDWTLITLVKGQNLLEEENKLIYKEKYSTKKEAISREYYIKKNRTLRNKLKNKKVKIGILLPYKENFSPEYPGAVSLFVNETSINSKYKRNIIIFWQY